MFPFETGSNPLSWNYEDVSEWILSLGSQFGTVAKTVASREVSGQDFQGSTLEDLGDIGISRLDAKFILKKWAQLNN